MAGRDRGGSSWSTGRILAVAIPVCLALAAVAVTLIIVMSKDDSSTTSQTAPNAVVPTEEEVVAMYDEMRNETQAALKEMQDLQSQEAMADAAVYQQEVAQAEAAIAQLETDVTEATAAVELAATDVSTAAGEATETQQQYQALLTELTAYYAYVEDLTRQAVEQVDYIQSTLPSLEEINGMKTDVTEVQAQPAQGRLRQIQNQLAGRTGKLSSTQSTATPPAPLQQYSASLDALSAQLGGISQQMSQALSNRNMNVFNNLASEMDSNISATFQQLSSGIANSVNSFSSQLSALTGNVQSAMPQK